MTLPPIFQVFHALLCPLGHGSYWKKLSRVREEEYQKKTSAETANFDSKFHNEND